MRRVLLDTPVLMADGAPVEVEAAISAASIAELHFGLLVANDPDETARRPSASVLSRRHSSPCPLTPRSPASGGETPRL